MLLSTQALAPRQSSFSWKSPKFQTLHFQLKNLGDRIQEAEGVIGLKSSFPIASNRAAGAAPLEPINAELLAPVPESLPFHSQLSTLQSSPADSSRFLWIISS